ncbi:MAG: hypothetical protein IJD20_03805 [Oscillospiraceae bacterium]|nr:hypothetical protein [Oscillospiraceae bacterium]MBR2080480.1 hypothetical protein [Oscillospiraceae bacterium]MBR2366763.1 hypothetical protein [Oscillospiraceae bacterium]MBR2897455.1 hypothetical protein [Oscillospiraceae bacterium]MBR2976716.1 hypothetical protein [Oscillospiraceae bacterium]
MATEKKILKPEDDRVYFYAMRDGGKYRDDILVAVNGKTFKIKRGERVLVPRYVAEILLGSMEQDAKAAAYMERIGSDYEAASPALS